MNETIKVIINLDGMSCKEMNQLGERPKSITSFIHNDDWREKEKYESEMEAWQDAESKLRTFEIIAEPIFNKQDAERERLKWIPGSIHTAQILDNGKVKIVE